MASKLPSGRWRAKAYYYEDGVRKSKSFTADTAKQADYMAMSFEASARHSSIKSNLTVHEATEAYINSNESILSPSTIKGYRAVQRAWMQDISETPLGRLDSTILQKWVSLLARDHSPKSVRNAWGLMSAVLATYMPDVTFRVNLPRVDKDEVVIPQPEDVKELIELSRGSNMYLPVLLAAHCGLRRSEMSALTWNDIDLKKKVIHIREAVVRGEDGWERKNTKSSAGKRDVDMTQPIYEYLVDADRSTVPVPLSPSRITKKFAKLSAKIGKDFHIHLLRHYYCSTLAMLGVPEAIAEKLCGHSSETVHKIYVHTLDEIERKYRENIVSHFNS